jgi:TPR repeat protein
MGLMYRYGKGVEKNYKKAIEWYQKASEQGHPGAGANIGCMYMKGEGVKQNYKKAMALFENRL